MKVALILLLGAFLGNQGPRLLYRMIASFYTKRLLKKLMPQPATEEKLCKSPHSWITCRVFDGTETVESQVCRVCGFVPSLNSIVSSEAIDNIEEANKIKEVEGQIYKDFLAKENSDLEKYFGQEISSGVSKEKLAALHTAGMTFGTRYNLYKSGRSGEIEKVLNKCDS